MIITLVVADIAAVALTIHATTPRKMVSPRVPPNFWTVFGTWKPPRCPTPWNKSQGKNVYVASHAAYIPGQICGLCSYRGIEKRI
jgi:hypothetical protein